MTKTEIIDICIQTVEEMREEWVPNPNTRYRTSTGNMAFNALRYEVTADGLVVGVDENIAPYAPYTEFPWISPKWRGKTNPNEGWWERFCGELARRIAAKTGGKIDYA